MTLASNLWNAQPIEKRKELHGILIEHDIRMLESEISRIKAAHAKQMREARSHLKNLRQGLEKWEQTQKEASAE